jgi:hypothetical protein
MLRIPDCRDNRLTDGGGKVVSPMRQGCQPCAPAAALLPRNSIFMLLVLISVKRLSKPQGLVRPEELGKLIKIIHLIGSRTRDLPVCNSVIRIFSLSPYLCLPKLFLI